MDQPTNSKRERERRKYKTTMNIDRILDTTNTIFETFVMSPKKEFELTQYNDASFSPNSIIFVAKNTYVANLFRSVLSI